MQVQLLKVYRTNKNKDGAILKTKDGRAYTRVSIKTSEHGDKWLSGFGANWNESWQEGETVSINVEQSGQYLNFSKLDPVDDLEARVKKLEDKVFAQSKTEDVPGDISIADDDLPF